MAGRERAPAGLRDLLWWKAAKACRPGAWEGDDVRLVEVTRSVWTTDKRLAFEPYTYTVAKPAPTSDNPSRVLAFSSLLMMNVVVRPSWLRKVEEEPMYEYNFERPGHNEAAMLRAKALGVHTELLPEEIHRLEFARYYWQGEIDPNRVVEKRDGELP